MSIVFNYDITGFRVRESRKIKSVIKKIISDTERREGEIRFIFTSDEKILDINREFLKHNYFTDIITFDYDEGNTVSGEIYISIDTVRENSEIFRKSFNDEIHRVIFHGILHLCGYSDKSEPEQKKMRYMEEKYLVFLSL